jgi:hypothetical protein
MSLSDTLSRAAVADEAASEMRQAELDDATLLWLDMETDVIGGDAMNANCYRCAAIAVDGLQRRCIGHKKTEPGIGLHTPG